MVPFLSKLYIDLLQVDLLASGASPFGREAADRDDEGLFCKSKLYTAVSRKFNLSEKVHATIPKGIVGGFHLPVFKTKFKEWQERPRTYVCEG